MSKKMRVYTAVVEHGEGHNLYIHKTAKGRDKALDEYIQENWDQEMDGVEMPKGDDWVTMTERYDLYVGNLDGHGESIYVEDYELED